MTIPVLRLTIIILVAERSVFFYREHGRHGGFTVLLLVTLMALIRMFALMSESWICAAASQLKSWIKQASGQTPRLHPLSGSTAFSVTKVWVLEELALLQQPTPPSSHRLLPQGLTLAGEICRVQVLRLELDFVRLAADFLQTNTMNHRTTHTAHQLCVSDS